MAKRVGDDFLKEVEIGGGRGRAEICFFFFFNDLLIDILTTYVS